MNFNNIPQNVISKLNVIKNVIKSTSGLYIEYGDDVEISLAELDFNKETGEVYEIVFEMNIKDVYCPECDFEPNSISETINEIISKINKGCNFGLTSDLQFTSSFNSTRGVLVYETKLWRDNFEYILFGIFIDPGTRY